jgi:hypothetical protein
MANTTQATVRMVLRDGGPLTLDEVVTRVIAMLDDQTLEDLHAAIQRAFGWDNDHLYAFFLSGRLVQHDGG